MTDSGIEQEYTERIAREIRVWLVRRDMTQQQLAERMGTNHLWLYRRLTGRTKFALDDLFAIAAALGCGVLDLLPEHPLLTRVGVPLYATVGGQTYLNGTVEEHNAYVNANGAVASATAPQVVRHQGLEPRTR